LSYEAGAYRPNQAGDGSGSVVCPGSGSDRSLWEIAAPRIPEWQAAYDLIEPQVNPTGVHVYDFKSTLPMDVRYLSFSPHDSIRPNRHDYFELMYAYSGEALYEVEDRVLLLREGNLFLIGGGLMHRMIEYPSGALKAVVLYFDPEILHGNCLNGGDFDFLAPFLTQDHDFPHIIEASTGLPRQILDLMERLAFTLPANSQLARLSADTYLKMILILLANHYACIRGNEPRFTRHKHNLKRLRPLFDYIDRCFAEPIAVDYAARLVNMSKSNFTRFFKQVTGESFVAYLSRFRVARAQVLLTTTDKSIAEVSQETGFCDQSYFGLVFRKSTGKTAREYRNQLWGTRQPASPDNFTILSSQTH
jgi:AraC-like DNA-binding protein/quercetin dioxygenase-like cupin family protein